MLIMPYAIKARKMGLGEIEMDGIYIGKVAIMLSLRLMIALLMSYLLLAIYILTGRKKWWKEAGITCVIGVVIFYILGGYIK
jgi:hypothetical protein